MYIYKNLQWPNFIWNFNSIAELLSNVRHKQGKLIGRMQGLGFEFQNEAVFEFITQDVLKTSEIEGEILSDDQVRSSLAKHLGVTLNNPVAVGKKIDGIVQLLLDATQNFKNLLTQRRMFDWHAGLFPTGRSGIRKIQIGTWRNDSDGPMQVISGPMGKKKVHFQAPSANKINSEINSFLKWFNQEEQKLDSVLKAAIAHLWFITIHPFEDGNGRIARAITDMALARSENIPQRFYSMSAQIQKERKEYYHILETTQNGSLDITFWLIWFLNCMERAIDGAHVTTERILWKANFWHSTHTKNLNQRQEFMLNLLIDGFKGKLTTSKWAVLSKCSQDTALRDIQDLVNRGILVKDLAGGRSTSYSLKID